MKVKVDITEIGDTLSLIAMFPSEGKGYELVYSLASKTFTESFRIEILDGKVYFHPCSLSRVPLNLTIQSQRLIKEKYKV